MTTGFHGFHVFVGTVFLTVALGRLLALHLLADHHTGFESAI
jgi:heme/copper-type cytochrome/quinol oxidase subunit 3